MTALSELWFALVGSGAKHVTMQHVTAGPYWMVLLRDTYLPIDNCFTVTPLHIWLNSYVTNLLIMTTEMFQVVANKVTTETLQVGTLVTFRQV